MDAQEIARSLGGASKGSNGWWQAKCPAHDDGTASLGLHDTDDGGVAWKCMAGCDKRAVGDALKVKGLLPERPRRERKATARLGPSDATYDYLDAAGALILQVLRYNTKPKKTFRQRRPDPDRPGEWIWKVSGISGRPLYYLAELLAADPADDVFLVEGEKDVDRLRSIGLTATTSSQGGGHWKYTDHAPLAGRHVVILPDNDDTGRSYAAEAGRDLIGKVASLRLLELPGVPAKGGDVSDWLDAGGTADELRHLAAQAPFYDPPPANEKPPPESEPSGHDDFERWSDKLHRTAQGEVRDIVHNAGLILRTDERFKGRLRWNAMLEAVEAQQLPWRKGDWLAWADVDDLQLAEWCQQRHAYLKPKTVAAAVQLVARDQVHHPVRERLESLVWDGTPRLSGWPSTYLGVADTAYSRAVGRAWLISAVARAFEPGCKADHVPILEGPQGIGKSTAISILAMDDAWFADEIADLGSKDSAQDLRGKWVVELGELSAMRRSDVERVKAFVSRRVDHYRPSYGVRSQDFPRHCIFVGSTNADAYLGDETGGRRFWPIKVGTIDLQALTRHRDQLLAEAAVAYRAGEKWWLDRDVERAARDEQEGRRVVDPWEERILEWAADQAEVTIVAALDQAIKMATDRQGQADFNRVARILRVAGWKLVQRRVGSSRSRFYVRPEAEPTRGIGPEPVTTCDRKASDSAPVTGVTGVTGISLTHACAPARDVRAHARAEVLRYGSQTRDTRDAPQPWTDLDHWRDRRRQAQTRADRVRLAIEWGRAAGGTVDDSGDSVRLKLPPDLRPSLALSELRQLARDAQVLA